MLDTPIVVEFCDAAVRSRAWHSGCSTGNRRPRCHAAGLRVVTEGVCGMRKVLAVGFLAIMALVIAAPPAAAQDKPVTINLGGGASFPVSGFKDSFDTGFNGAIGATFHFSPT